MSQLLADTLSESELVSRKPGGKKRSLILVWIGLLLIAVVGLVASYQFQTKVTDEKTHSLLQSIAESKVALLEGWLSERYANLATFTENTEFIDLYPLLESKVLELEQVEAQIKSFNAVYGYEKTTLIGVNGQVIASKGAASINVTEHTSYIVEKARKELAVQTYMYVSDDLFHLDFVAPIVDRRDGKSEYLGSIVLHMDPEKFIVPMLAIWPGSTKSGRTELVFSNLELYGKQVLHLSISDESRYLLATLN